MLVSRCPRVCMSLCIPVRVQIGIPPTGSHVGHKRAGGQVDSTCERMLRDVDGDVVAAVDVELPRGLLESQLLPAKGPHIHPSVIDPLVQLAHSESTRATMAMCMRCDTGASSTCMPSPATETPPPQSYQNKSESSICSCLSRAHHPMHNALTLLPRSDKEAYHHSCIHCPDRNCWEDSADANSLSIHA